MEQNKKQKQITIQLDDADLFVYFKSACKELEYPNIKYSGSLINFHNQCIKLSQVARFLAVEARKRAEDIAGKSKKGGSDETVLN